ncbi:tRNA (adenosine(37)-N6)-methyltransferase TrmM [Pasteurellaceae bacterium 15-036681]|nr:tRNA (adenosine(37)-N6)-methyltransferase TrmM [Pasteurellaceae bacterium 15-036681]
MANLGFQFKQFFIAHDQCAMKVNTDGILLGAIANLANVQHILDLGTGSGLIAIMLAQRTSCTPQTQITALELEQDAYFQALSNTQQSPWSERINVVQGDIMQVDFPNKFDLIVSNPPYFEHSLASRNEQRDLARAVVVSHLDWLQQAKKWLSEKGKITFILPKDSADRLIQQVEAQNIGLYCVEYWAICTKQGKVAKRSIVSFSAYNQPRKEKELVIYGQDNQYSEEFRELTKEFYLNM